MEGRGKDPFPLISDGERRPPTWQEDVFGDHPRWREGKRGEPKGTVTITERGKDFDASFRLDGEEALEYSGEIPGKGSWRGKSPAERRGGPGPDAIEVDSTNPKRWG